MRATIYGRKLLWAVNPIYPDSSLVYYNHNIYEAKNVMTPTQVYYYVDRLRHGDTPTIQDYPLEDLEYLAEKLPDMRVVLKNYIKHKKLEEK